MLLLSHCSPPHPSVIAAPLQDAGPPPEVLRAAQREFRRLQRGSDQHPGYGMSLAYLETLADLPWSRLSSGQHPPAQQGAGGAEGAMPEQLQQQQPQQELPLSAVRQRLDEAHYGLDKIKERIVQFVAVQRLRCGRTAACTACPELLPLSSADMGAAASGFR